MSKIYIYLAGPISGLDEGAAVDWRNMIEAHLHDMSPNLVAVSPLRCEPPDDDGMYPGVGGYDDVLSRHITAKNLLDVKQCDLVLAYLPAKNALIGTLQEIGWATAWGKPIIVLSNREDILTHPILKAAVPFLYDARKKGWKKAMETIKGLFEVYT